MDTILALDAGTTNVKAILVNSHGNVLARASAALAIQFPRSGWVEQSAAESACEDGLGNAGTLRWHRSKRSRRRRVHAARLKGSCLQLPESRTLQATPLRMKQGNK